MSEPTTAVLPDYLFRTPSPLVAAWLSYSRRLQFMHYDAERREYIFYDPDNLSHELIHDYNAVDPTVNLRRFHKTYQSLLTEKLKLDARLRDATRAVRRG